MRGFAHFSLTLESQTDELHTVKKETSHTFEGRESDWGFTQYLGLAELNDLSKGNAVWIAPGSSDVISGHRLLTNYVVTNVFD